MTTKLTAPLTDLLTLMGDAFFYTRQNFDGRMVFQQVCANGMDAVSFEVKPGTPFLLAGATKGPTQRLYDQLVETARQSETVGLIVTFDSRNQLLSVHKRRFRDNGFDAIQALEHYFKPAGNGRKFSRPISGAELENMFFEAHSAMRDIDGVHPDAALEELCKLIYLKSYVEEQAIELRRDGFGCNEEYAAALRGHYRDAVEYDLRVFALRIPEYKRSRGVFDEPIFLSSAALTKSFDILADINLTNLKTDVKGRAFQKVLGKSVRAGMGQYFTPAPVCELMVQLVAPKSTDLILDPFCGSGHFLRRSLEYVRRSRSGVKEVHEFAFGKLHGIEKSERMTRIAMTDMRLHGDGHANIRCTDALISFDNYPDLNQESFDVVITNPPFGSLLSEEALGTLPRYTLAKNRRRVPLEFLGLERAVQFLRPGGKLAIVLPESVFSSKSASYVREWIHENISVRLVIDLPPHTFAPFGANIRSGILIGRKLFKGEPVNPNNKAFMVKLEHIGYDASGRSTSQLDLQDSIDAGRNFLAREGW